MYLKDVINRSKSKMKMSTAPIVRFNSGSVIICPTCDREYQFGISDLQGKILKRGKFNNQREVYLDALSPGHYELSLFNEEDAWKFPFKWK